MSSRKVPESWSAPGKLIASRLSLMLCWLLIAAAAEANEWTLSDTARIRTATETEGQAALGTSDLYIERMSPFDLAVRLQTAEPTTKEAYLRLAASQVRAFTAEDEQHLNAALEILLPRLQHWQLPWPRQILLVKASAEHEAAAAYCRGPIIVLPESRINSKAEGLANLLAHEMFHVLSNQNPELRRKLYALVGFEPGSEVELPAAWAARRLTNPDAPTLSDFARLKIADREVLVVPLLYADPPQYDPTAKKTLFNYLQFRLLEVEPAGDGFRAILDERGQPRLHDVSQTPDYYAKIGRNTGYIIHPEEVLADNFALLARGAKNVPTPELLAKLDAALKEMNSRVQPVK